MQITNKHALLIFIEREGHEAWTVVPAADGIHLVAVNESGETRRFTWIDNDFMLDQERFRAVQMLPDKEFIAVPVED
jgi:predicted RNA-binding protein with EMAP domain